MIMYDFVAQQFYMANFVILFNHKSKNENHETNSRPDNYYCLFRFMQPVSYPL